MQSKNAFNYIALTSLLLSFLMFNIACTDDLRTPYNIGNQAEVNLSEFMQAAEALALANDADFNKNFSILKGKYQKLVNKPKLHEGKSQDGRYILHLLFANKITKEIADLVEEIYNLSNNKTLLINSLLPDGRTPTEILANNTNLHNHMDSVNKLLVFLVSKDPANINQLSIGQMHKVFGAITDEATLRLSYLALTDKLAYLQDAFSKNQSSVINLILASLEDDEAKELRTMLITEATKMAKNESSAATNLENLLSSTEDWGFGIDASFDVNERIITLIVKTLEADLFDSGVQGLITSLSAIISSHMSTAEWLRFSQAAFDIIASQGLRAVAWRLLNIDEPYKKVVDDLNSAHIALREGSLADFNTHIESANRNLLSFLNVNVIADIKELAELNLAGGDKLTAMIAKFPANEHTFDILSDFLFKLRQLFSNKDYVNDDYNGITLLQILAGDGFVRPLADDPNYLAEQLVVLMEFDASINVLGDVFSKIEEVLNKIISFRGHYWPALDKAFASINLAVWDEATVWSVNKYKPSWHEMYKREATPEQKQSMRSYLLKELLKNKTNFTRFINEIDHWGLSLTDTYDLDTESGTLIDVLVASAANDNALSSLYSELLEINPSLLPEAFRVTKNTAEISLWAYNNREIDEVRSAFKSYLGSVSEAGKVEQLKEGLRTSARYLGLTDEFKNQANDWGLPADDEIFKARATVEDVLETVYFLATVAKGKPSKILQVKLLNCVNEAVTDEASARLLLSTGENKNIDYFLMLIKSDLGLYTYKSIEKVLNLLPTDEAKRALNDSGYSPLSLLLRDRGDFEDSFLDKTIKLLTDKGADAKDLLPNDEFDKYIKIFIDDEYRLNKIYENLTNKNIIFAWIRHLFHLKTLFPENYSLRNIKIFYNVIFEKLDDNGKKEFKKLLLEQAISAARKKKFKILFDVLYSVSVDDFSSYEHSNILTFIMNKLKNRDLETYAQPDGLIKKLRDSIKQKIDEHNINYPAQAIDWSEFIKGAIEIARTNNANITMQVLSGQNI